MQGQVALLVLFLQPIRIRVRQHHNHRAMRRLAFTGTVNGQVAVAILLLSRVVLGVSIHEQLRDLVSISGESFNARVQRSILVFILDFDRTRVEVQQLADHFDRHFVTSLQRRMQGQVALLVLLLQSIGVHIGKHHNHRAIWCLELTSRMDHQVAVAILLLSCVVFRICLHEHPDDILQFAVYVFDR